ncbi:immunoglobulin-like domain-containing protein [Pseudomonas sp. 148P]|uniref:Immunoglobulin-like domain-containing protein n=1 Tax=Pseudomonas ulcerans TaxID=3115852 RepID=A0ABU7I2I4_9PSED|nr:immunoglobulin-like domain-containing protein [Pseudomonas sp. 148P]MEE1937816.1 immunoglobulin-like domain-containing protein [Pseudomonas sp. 148P]
MLSEIFISVPAGRPAEGQAEAVPGIDAATSGVGQLAQAQLHALLPGHHTTLVSITIPVNSSSGSVDFIAPNNVLNTNTPLTNSITGVTGGNYEHLTASPASPVATTSTWKPPVRRPPSSPMTQRVWTPPA